MFFSKNLNPNKYHYEIYDEELLAIIQYFKKQKLELEASGVPIKVIADHKSLKYFITTEKLSKRQAYCAKFLAQFNFVISYIPDGENRKANSFTCRLNNCPIDDHNN